MDEPIPALSIGSIEGGSSPSMSRWRDAINEPHHRGSERRTGRRVPAERKRHLSDPREHPATQLRRGANGSHSRKDASLIVQAALPDDAPDDVESHIRHLLIAAIDEAEEWARRRSIAPDLRALRQLAGEL